MDRYARGWKVSNLAKDVHAHARSAVEMAVVIDVPVPALTVLDRPTRVHEQNSSRIDDWDVDLGSPWNVRLHRDHAHAHDHTRLLCKKILQDPFVAVDEYCDDHPVIRLGACEEKRGMPWQREAPRGAYEYLHPKGLLVGMILGRDRDENYVQNGNDEPPPAKLVQTEEEEVVQRQRAEGQPFEIGKEDCGHVQKNHQHHRVWRSGAQCCYVESLAHTQAGNQIDSDCLKVFRIAPPSVHDRGDAVGVVVGEQERKYDGARHVSRRDPDY